VPADAPTRRQARFLRHHEEDDPGLVGRALERRGFDVDVVLVTDETPTVDLTGVDVVGVLGSKWSVYDHERVGGWIEVELETIRRADQCGIAVLGICFGAQALCTAMGGSVSPAASTELGWVGLEGVPDEGLPEGPWFEFHSDLCVLPTGARVLARNEVCVQAFRIGRHLGVQFHPEIDAAQFARWLEAGADAEAAAHGESGELLLKEIGAREVDAAARVDRLVAGFLARAGT
jgi:GMP synthase-like glutamine amidotransferase